MRINKNKNKCLLQSDVYFCFSFFFLHYLVSGYVCYIKLTTFSFSVHVKLSYRIVSAATT